MVEAHDGSDYANRQRILPHYQLMALSKKRLNFIIILHYLIALLVATKLVPTVLDMFNIFVQPIEELYIPMAQPWEWIWISGVLVTGHAFKAIRTNSPFQLKLFIVGVILTCLGPLIYAAYHYSSDFRTFVITRDAQKTSEVWMKYPVALYWYIFIVVAGQVHGFELYFGWELLSSLSGHRSANKNK